MKIESTLLAPNQNIFQLARKDKNLTEPTEKGLRQASDLAAQYGSSRKVAVAGDVAVALKPQTFDEMTRKFGEATEVKAGIYTFNAAGSNLTANWYKSAMEDEGYGAADKDKDGYISNHESFLAKRMIDFDAQGRVFLDRPRQGEIPDNNEIYISLNDATERNLAYDKNKDGAISNAEFKEKKGLDIDNLRKAAMAARGQNPDGTWALPPVEEWKPDPSDLQDRDAGEGEKDASSLRDKLRELERQIGELRGQRAGQDEQKLKELVAAEQQLLKQIAQADGYRPVSEKA